MELSANKLHLIFERLDKDLKKYLESLDPAMMNPNLIKVNRAPFFAPSLKF